MGNKNEAMLVGLDKSKIITDRMIQLYEQLATVRDENEEMKKTINSLKKMLILAISLLFILLILVRLSK